MGTVALAYAYRKYKSLCTHTPASLPAHRLSLPLNLVIQYDGWPNGLKFHKDGRVFIADYKKGLLALDPQTARPSTSPKRCPVIF
jgi:hypothetical protein